ncbi:MAG: hypothetical protein AAGG75_16390 [Bacteroidota bacterium]
MKKKWKIIGAVFFLLIICGVGFVMTPVDIRPDYLAGKIKEQDLRRGRVLLQEMQAAYGGKDSWLAHQTGSFAQIADWYDNKLGIAGWDELPQKFQMTSRLGTDDSAFTLLNGMNEGQTWGVEGWRAYQVKNGVKEFMDNKKYQHKLIYKNYWFQFPFRIGEAPIIAYAGESTVNGKPYDLLYVTWGSEKANRQYDQYVLYLDKVSKRIEWLHFTLREKVKFMHITARFADFKTVNGIVAPFSQYITFGSPEKGGPKMHENKYQWIQFGEVKVMR